MKKLFLIPFFIVGLFSLDAQCDIQQFMSTLPNAIPVGQTTTCTFDVFNDAAGSSCEYPVASVEAVLSLPSNGLAFQSLSSPAHGPYFDWVYDAFENVVIGINHTAIPDGQGDFDVTVVLVGTALPTYPQFKIVGLNLGQNPDGPVFPSNNETNDNSQSSVEIQAPLPIELISFSGRTEDCDHIMLNWSTSSEVNNDYMEILRSSNGKQFFPVGKVKGSNNRAGGSYSFKDDTDLQLGKKYYYMIRQVDQDGTKKVYNIIIVNFYCGTMIPEFSIYPNPASDIVNVSFSGISKDQETELVFLNKLGVVAKKLKVKTDETTEIEIRDMPTGVYKVQTLNLDDNLSERFIHIR